MTLYRVKKEVNNLKPFTYLAFPGFACHQALRNGLVLVTNW